EDPADFRHARLHDVGRPRVDDRPDPEDRRLVLAARERDPERRAHARETRTVLGGPHGLLEPAEVEAPEGSADAARLPPGPRAFCMRSASGSICVGSWPSTIGASASSATLVTARVAP